MIIAVTREISPSMGQCELTFLERVEIDIPLARAQHAAYQQALVQAGCQVVSLPVEPDLPDSVFVEDAAIVLDEAAVITRPGAESRRPETASVAQALQAYRPLIIIEAPGTLDGGDALCAGKKIFIGSSSRSNRPGIDQLSASLSRFGYQVIPVPVGGCLHLKSAVTQVSPETLLLNRAWVDTGYFQGYHFIDVDSREPDGANALMVGNHLIYSVSHPYTRERLEKRGYPVIPMDISEVEKAEGAVTCCSLIFRVP